MGLEWSAHAYANLKSHGEGEAVEGEECHLTSNSQLLSKTAQGEIGRKTGCCGEVTLDAVSTPRYDDTSTGRILQKASFGTP